MIVSQCCGAMLIAMFEEPVCTECKGNCETWDDEEPTIPLQRFAKDIAKTPKGKKIIMRRFADSE